MLQLASICTQGALLLHCDPVQSFTVVSDSEQTVTQQLPKSTWVHDNRHKLHLQHLIIIMTVHARAVQKLGSMPKYDSTQQTGRLEATQPKNAMCA